MAEKDSNVNVFPYILTRVSGGPFGEIEALNAAKAAYYARQIYRRQQQLDTLKTSLSDALYDVIGGDALQSDVRQTLINLRRDLFNKRPVASETVSALAPFLPAALLDSLQTFVGIQAEIEQLEKEGKARFVRESIAARKHLQRLTQRDNLRKGLLLSSRSLLKYGVPRYLDADLSDLKKQELKTERSLVKYISRIYAKTSPFSTFTNLAITRLASQNGRSALTATETEETAVVSHIRLNNYFYQYLIGVLLKYRDYYRHFRLRPNPTLRQEQDCFVYLTNSYNVEAFQRLPANPVVTWFLTLTAQRPEGIVYQELVETIVEAGKIEATAAQLENYINQLIEYGFFEFNIGVSGIDPDWDIKFRARLAELPADVPHLQELQETLAQVRALAQQFGKAGVGERRQILETAYEQFKAICMKLHAAAGLPEREREWAAGKNRQNGRKNTSQTETPGGDEAEAFRHQTTTYFHFRPENMFYEDTSLDSTLYLDGEETQEIASLIYDLFAATHYFESHLSEQDKMRHYYRQRYGDAAAVNLLTFYEEYYRDFKKVEAENENGQQKPPPVPEAAQKSNPDLLAVPRLEARKANVEKWFTRFSEQFSPQAWSGEDRVDLSLAQIAESTADLFSRSPENDRNSHATFAQLFIDETSGGKPQLMAVLNSTVPGFGKYMSRFLHLFTGEITATVRHWNQGMSRGEIMAEVADASYFNANLHPPLMPFEVRIPSGHNSLPSQYQIPVTALQVRLDEEKDELFLFHPPSQSRVYPFDLGFESLRGRSQLFQLLGQFTMADHMAYWPLLDAINRHVFASTQEAPALVRPRVVYEDRIVLQRKAWLVPKKRLPLQESNESDWDYFNRINRWRLALEIPDEVFIFVVARKEMWSGAQEILEEIGSDHYKPQYINFENPLLVDLFGRLLPKVPTYLTIEEMLPNSRQLFKVGQQRHITEFILQWYCGAQVEKEEA